jgi:hypothetical protein
VKGEQRRDEVRRAAQSRTGAKGGGGKGAKRRYEGSRLAQRRVEDGQGV